MNHLLRRTPYIVEIINYDQTAIEGYNAILVEVTTPEGLDEAGSLDREQFYAYTSLKESLSRDIQDQTATREKYRMFRILTPKRHAAL